MQLSQLRQHVRRQELAFRVWRSIRITFLDEGVHLVKQDDNPAHIHDVFKNCFRLSVNILESALQEMRGIYFDQRPIEFLCQCLCDLRLRSTRWTEEQC